MILPFSATRTMIAAVAIALGGCVTPIEVKTASKKQLELIDSLDQATRDLESALATFHRNNQQLIRNQARVAIARQSIDVALNGATEKVTADELFEAHKSSVRPWIDYSFEEVVITKRIEQLKTKMAATNEAIERLKIRNELTGLEAQKARLASKPNDVADLEAVFSDELEAEQATIEALRKQFAVLRQQIATMKATQTRVDAWLSIDVAVSQEQIDSLTESFRAAHEAFSGGGQ